MRALSDVLGKKLPFDSLGAATGKALCGPSAFRGSQRDCRRQRRRNCRTCEKSREDDQIRVCVSGQRLLFDEPDSARFRRHGRVLGVRPQQLQSCGGIGQGRSWTLSFRLCLARAHHDRPVAAAAGRPADLDRLSCCSPTARSGRPCRLRRGPNVVGPCGLFQSFADLLKFVFKEPVIPSGANKAIFLLAPLVAVTLALADLGGGPARRRLGDRQHQCRHPLHVRDLLARGLRHHHGRLGVELEISVPRRAAVRGADGVLRSLDRLRHRHRAARASVR